MRSDPVALTPVSSIASGAPNLTNGTTFQLPATSLTSAPSRASAAWNWTRKSVAPVTETWAGAGSVAGGGLYLLLAPFPFVEGVRFSV